MRKINKKSIIFILIAVASLAALSGCKPKNSPVTDNGQNNNAATSTPNGETATSSPETEKMGYEIIEPKKTDCKDEMDTTCWKTFVDHDYKITINYPLKFEFNNYGSSRYKKGIYAINFLDSKEYRVTMSIEKNNDDVTNLNFNDWKANVSEIKPREEKQIGNYNGILIVEWDGRDSIGYYFYIIQPDKIITFREDFNGQTIKDKKIFEKMIESLKLF